MSAFSYSSPRHKNLPHIVKFSGGRSSGMLLFRLLESNLLQAERGDVVIFNNTSAEHPRTYEFTAKCKEIVEEKFGIPFLFIQFQTYEDARGGEWVRLPSYRLVKPVPWSKDEPDGYFWKGEVFEEMLSWAGFVPNQFQRTCTKTLKLETTRRFLQDWFEGKTELEYMGHYGDGSRMTDEDMYVCHQKHGGKTPREIFLAKKSYVRSRSVSRPAQMFADFSESFTPIKNLQGDDEHAEYLAFLGLRHDEPHRVARIRQRNTDSDDGEHVEMPLADEGVTREDVNEFWAGRKWDLELPEDAGLSNCVYCFLKGAGGLRKVKRHMQNGYGSKDFANTPCDINWWHNMEERYGRDLIAEERKTNGDTVFLGFFGDGRDRLSYKLLVENSGQDISKFSDAALPCDCTD